jgi:hypothetical protein
MNSPRLSFCTILLFLAVVFFYAGRLDAVASAEDQIDQAVAASKNWVAQIDAGKFEESYAFTCSAMRDKTPVDRWVAVLKALRKPWGPVVNRKQLSHIYKPNGVPGLNGECMVVTYDTAFKNLDPATEVVVLKWEDGKWRGAGYNAGPKQTDDTPATTAMPNPTETHTESHVKPVPQ